MVTRRIVVRRLAGTLLALGAAVLVWRSRVIQVASFAVAAGLRGQYRGRVATGPASKYSEWATLPPPPVRAAPLNPLALVTYHPEYHAFEARRAVAGLMAVARLGAGWVRTDVRWREILPDGIRPDSRALAWYRAFLSGASACGLRSMVVLSTPPEAVLRQGTSARLESWSRYVEAVVSELGTQCGVYQLMNEPNNPIYRFFSLEDAAIALVRGASVIRSICPGARVAVNVNMEVWRWRKYLADLLRLSGRSIDIIGLDHYPGTWTIGWQDRWAEVIQLADLIASAAPGSLWFGRHLMIMETGFSTNTCGRGHVRQSEYFERVMPVVKNLKSRSTGDDAVLGVYELCDGDSSAWLDPEAHFGLLTCEMLPKAAFMTVQEGVASL